MNILIMNLKGGATKTTTSSLVASYIGGSRLMEIDKINQSDKRIKSNDYDSVQIDFTNEQSEHFIEFENMLLEKNKVNIIDVGASMLEIFHKAMTVANLYETIDLLIVPAMDGSDDFLVAMKFLENVKGKIDSSKVLFALSRYNNNEYDSVEEQFDTFFDNTENIKKAYGIDLQKNYFVIKDSRAIKKARKKGVTLKSLADVDVTLLTKKQRAEEDPEKRLQLTRERSLVISAKNLYSEYIVPMMDMIQKKLKDIKKEK